jgi:hypothetical protein
MTRRGKKNRNPDKLIVQVALKVKIPRGKTLSKNALQEILDRMVAGDELPKNVEVRGIFWRNPNRKGSLSYWRYHTGADLSAKPAGPIESTPRGNLQGAIESLSPFMDTGGVSF